MVYGTSKISIFCIIYLDGVDHGEFATRTVPRFLAHDRCKVRDLRHGRYVDIPIRSITIYYMSAPTAYTFLSPCSRMAVDDR